MRIAIVPSSDLSYNSGSIIAAKQTFSELWDYGHDVWILASKHPHDFPREKLGNIVIFPEILEHPIIDDRKISDRDLLVSISKTLEFLYTLHDKKPIDLVHVQYFSFTSFAAATFGSVTGVPCIVSSFGRDLSVGFPSDKRLERLARDSLKYISHIITPNEKVEHSVNDFIRRESFSIPCSIVPQWFDELILEGATPEQQELLISTVNSCFTPEKGIDDIIHAFSFIKKTFPSARLVIAGADDHPLQINKNRLLSLINKLSLSDSVNFSGYLSRQEVGRLISQSTIFIDARHEGNFSSVLLESQFLGAAVVCSNTDSAMEIVQDGINGYQFQSKDWRDLSALLLKVLRNPPMLMLARQGAKQWAERIGKKYSKSVAFDSLNKIYSEVKRNNS